MPLSPAQTAKRALIRVLLALAVVYSVVVNLTREAPDVEVLAAYRKIVRKAHPDKGGKLEDAQRLQAAKDAWDEAKRRGGVGRPAGGRNGGAAPEQPPPGPDAMAQEAVVADPAEQPKDYRINTTAVLLTYMGVSDLAQWRRFTASVCQNYRAWQLKHWCATLECTQTGIWHSHLMVQFTKKQDCAKTKFAFEGIPPRADPNDILGDGFCKGKMQESINRGMFYCWADKIGTVRDENGVACTAGNYEPCWTQARCKYAVLGKWPEKLWKAHKLTHEVYERYLFACRDGVIGRKRNLDAVRERQITEQQEEERAKRVLRIRGNAALFQPFPEVPAARAWLDLFKEDRLRYPLLIVVGPSSTGKTEWAKTLFRSPLELKVGSLEHFPEKMRSFTRGTHDGLILDDVRDLQFLVRHQEKVQGKYDATIEFGSTPGGGHAYHRDLYAIPIVVTANHTTLNLELLDTSDWLGSVTNRTVLRWPPT